MSPIPVFGPLLDANCDLCWLNERLEGGTVIGETENLYAYLQLTDDQQFKYGLIAPKAHYPGPQFLPMGWGEEFGQHIATFELGLPSDYYNGCWNKGFVAGQRVMGHWHVRIEPRFPNQPASNMGPSLTIAKYNTLVTRLRELEARCTDAHVAKELRHLLKNAVIV